LRYAFAVVKECVNGALSFTPYSFAWRPGGRVVPPKLYSAISVKEPASGTFHRQPFLTGPVELAIGALLERVLVLVLVEVALLEDMLLEILEVELGTTHALTAAEVRLRLFRGRGAPSTVPTSTKGRRVLRIEDILENG
jgi:hypothetical protein